ncbi:hypothetical protein Tco_1455457, partial [Tanacetum coccineum]
HVDPSKREFYLVGSNVFDIRVPANVLYVQHLLIVSESFEDEYNNLKRSFADSPVDTTDWLLWPWTWL